MHPAGALGAVSLDQLLVKDCAEREVGSRAVLLFRGAGGLRAS